MSSRTKLKMVASGMEAAAGEATRAGRASVGFAAARVAPDPEVRAVAKRRQFSAAYEFEVLTEAGRLTEHRAIWALLRREGLYSLHLSVWRRERRAHSLERKGLGDYTEADVVSVPAALGQCRKRARHRQFSCRGKHEHSVVTHLSEEHWSKAVRSRRTKSCAAGFRETGLGTQ